ncbi:hypothetical protein L1267_16915 [Pseudoalteromonas sp. OFAV1]|uniref:hypothetical protein n=1 Tax=Pseudoalteromonas sp. OFAV1 TaxID=2908892 RepID=UPI001F3A41A9|nr:hypothetical protein [Pseudoalteromonas sp. OFAV1]MCF2902059.1 hypothetical protein [Pseudoalteromonas sp. OFAV1]
MSIIEKLLVTAFCTLILSIVLGTLYKRKTTDLSDCFSLSLVSLFNFFAIVTFIILALVSIVMLFASESNDNVISFFFYVGSFIMVSILLLNYLYCTGMALGQTLRIKVLRIDNNKEIKPERFFKVIIKQTADRSTFF